jgi:HEAT repeat protein
MTDWIWWWNLGFPALVGGYLLWGGFVQNHRRLQLWRDAVALCRLTEEKSSGFFAWRAKLTARSGPIEIRITDARGKGDQVKVVIEGAEGFSAVELRRQILKLWKDEIEIGDEDFDDAFLVEGPIRPVCARLDAAMRRQLVRASAACAALEIGGGQLRAEVSEKVLSRILPLLLYISRQLAQPVDEEHQIARNARRDPKAGVRLVNLLLLIRERPGDPETLRALRRACSDASPEIRLRAALELGEEGHDVLLKLAESSSDDASCTRAVSHLGSRLSFEKAKNILSSSLRKGLFETARACLEVLGHHRDSVGVLERVMTEEKGELAAAAALALGKTGEAAAEPPLLQALQSEDSDLREAAATALGRVGSVAAVQPLREAAERSLFDLTLRQAARQAVTEIQSRLHGASPGQISLAEAEAGQLSLAPFEAGQLSLAPDEAGPFPPLGQRLRN